MKIKIMNKREQITDEELERFKNFDALLAKHNAGISTKPWLKLGAGVTFVLALSAIIYYFTSQPKATIIQEPIQADGARSEPSTNKPLPDTLMQEAVPATKTPSKISSIKQAENQIEASKKEEQVTAAPVYVQAEPIDGYAKLYEYFNRELIYPPSAVADSIQGVLTISFTINKQGTAENFQFNNSLGKLFEEEATRLIQQMPAWRPATVNGTPVSSRMSLPLTFQIQKQKN